MKSSAQASSSRPAPAEVSLELDKRDVLSDRRSWLVLLIVFIAQLWTLSRVEGYQLADSVEYMDRAWDFARGNGVGPESPRSFAFSGFLLPIFAVAEWIGVEDFKPVVLLVRLTLMGFGLLTLAVVLRMASRLYSREVAFACALLLGLCPVFLRYTISPLSGPAAMLFMALAFEALFVPPQREQERPLSSGLRVGLWLGLGLLAAYQTMLVAGPLLLIALLRDRLKRRRFWFGLATAYLACALAQCLLDLAIYNEFGSTLKPYLGSNGGAIVSRILWDIGLTEPATWIYLNFVEHVEIEAEYLDKTGELTQLQPKSWYVRELGRQLFAWPAVALLFLGGARIFRRPNWVRTALTIALIANVGLMSMKGAKSFRLWLPILPLLALAIGDGLFLLLHDKRGARRRLATLPVALLVLISLAWGLQITRDLQLKRYGDFWRAMETVVDHAHENETSVTVASSYHWATLFRREEGVESIKLSYDLDTWQSLGEPERARVLMELNGIDFLITHSQAIEQDPRIMEVVGQRYRIHEVYWGEGRARELGPVYLLVSPRAELPLRGRKFFQTRAGVEASDIEAMRSRIQHPSRLVFESDSSDKPPFSANFLGWELEPIGTDGQLAWVTYFWWARKVDGVDYRFHDRFTDRNGRQAWNNRSRAYGAVPTSVWTANSLISESYLLTATNRNYRYGEFSQGGQWIPAELYLSVQTAAAPDDSEPAPPLAIIDATERRLVAPAVQVGPDQTERPLLRLTGAAGMRWNQDGMLQVGSDWLPVPNR